MSSFCCIKDGINFYNKLNPKKARAYCHDLVIKASERMAEIFKTSTLLQNEAMIGNMNCIEIPIHYSENNMKLVYSLCLDLAK